MDEEFKKLHDYVAHDQYPLAVSFLQDIANTFDKEISDAVIDTYILNIFDESYGFLSFIRKTVDKKFDRATISEAITECIEVIYSLAKNFARRIEKYTPQIREVCLKIVLTVNSKTKEKRRALTLLGLLFEQTDYFPDGYLSKEQVMSKLYSCYESATGEVLGLTIKTLGIMLKQYPGTIDNPNILYKSMLIKLKANIADKSDSPVGECFSFLSAFLAVYSDVDVADVYQCIKKRMSIENYRQTSLREGISLLAQHVVLFEKQIYKDAEFWHNILKRWLDLKGENVKTAYSAFDALYGSLSRMIAVNNPANRILCMKFWPEFVRDVFHSDLHGYKLHVAIRGFGHFASTAKVFLPKDEINATFYDYINKIEQTYLIDPDGKPEDLDYLPEYIQTLSNIIQELDDVTEYELGILQRATVLVIRLFPHLSSHHHNLVVVPTVKAYSHIRTRGKTMAKQYLLHIVKEGVIYSCSHALAGEDVEYYRGITTYRNYLPFWKNLIGKRSISSAVSDLEDNSLLQIQTEIFDELMATLLCYMDKLNLSTRLTEDFSTLTDPKVTLRAVKVNDFNIFVNIVDLYVDILKSAYRHLFKKWVQRFLNNVMVKCKKHPLVSGFYKLLAIGLDIANDLNYFDASRLEREDIKLCYATVTDSVNNILAKIKLYNDDLKISCIRVILSTPVSIISGMLTKIAPVIISVFVLGRSNLEFAELGVDTLERWHKAIKQEDFDAFLREILPYLDTYLSSKSISEKFDAKTGNARKRRQLMNRRKIVTITEGDLFKIQKRILSFIAGLSNEMCRSFVEDNDTIGDSSLYSKDLHLKVKLQFMNNFQVDLYLEKLIPRIIELALYSSERKLRINACEVLHAMVLVFLGRTKEMNDEPKKDLHGLLKKVTGALLLLGCDADITVQKLLRPLMLQLMHWYSCKLMKLCSHTALVVETVLDGVTQTTDSSLRDFSCLCVKEFVDWSIKQSSRSGIARDPVNIQIVLRKIKFFSSHSDPSKRFAAALIFNNIYTILREEVYLFQVYWIELLHCFVTNLSLIDEYDEYDCLAQVNLSLDHLQRGFVEKSGVFNQNNRDRRIPVNFDGCLLVDVACWLLEQTGSSNRHCREKCFNLFINIAPLCQKGDLSGFLKYFQTIRGSDWMQTLYFRESTLKMDDLKVEILFKWMGDFLCLLDAHLFFQRSGIATDESDLPTLHEAAHCFYRIIYPNNLQKLGEANRNFLYGPMDKERFNTLRNNIAKKYVRYFLISGSLSEEEHWNLFTKMIFENDNLLSEDIHAQEVNFLLDNMEEDLTQRFISSVYSYLSQNPLVDCDLHTIVPFKQRQILKGLLILTNSRLSPKISLKEYLRDGLKRLVNKMVDGEGIVVNLQNTAKEYCQLKIDLCLKSGDIDLLVDLLSDVKLVKTSQQRNETEFGKYFFENFKSTIIQSLVNDFDRFLRTLVAKISSNTLYFVEEIVEFIASNSKLFSDEIVKGIVERILSHWVAFVEFYDGTLEDKVGGLILLEKIGRLSSGSRTNSVAREAWSWLMAFMGSLNSETGLLPHKKYEVLNCCVAALPGFLRGIKEGDLEDLLEHLKGIEENYFAHLEPGMKIPATLFVNKSFQAAIMSKSKFLFTFTSKMFVLVEANDELNVDQFCKLFMANVESPLQLELLTLIYNAYCMTSSLEVQHRLVKEILSNLLRYAEYDAFETFYTENITEIMRRIKKKSEDSLQYAEKSNAFVLIRILFSRIRKYEGGGGEVICPITLSAYPGTKDGKQLMKETIRDTSQLLKDSCTYEDDILRNWDRICKCECYNALISVVCNTQRDTVWYDLLFKREVKGRNMLWRNIVDVERDYSLPVDFEKMPKRREHLVAIRSAYRAKKNPGVAESLKYIESQNILNSTVSEDIVKYDLSRTILRSQSYEGAKSRSGDNKVEMQIDIDGDVLNSHECMLMLCGLFQHLHNEQIYVTQSNSTAPAFIQMIKKDLESDDTPPNVKLFLIKALENKRELFKPYANVLFGPIMKAIVDGVAGGNINYFVADLIVMLVFWAEDSGNVEGGENVSKLAHFLIRNVNTARYNIMKYHIDLIKFFVEQWKNQISVPKDYLLERLRELAKSEKVLPIVHICSIFLANHLPPWNDIRIFVTKLIEILAVPKANVYRSCAEAIGAALAYAKVYEKGETLSDFTNYLVKHLKRLKEKNSNKVDEHKQLVCLQSIMKNYPEICDEFLNGLVFKYKRYSGPYKGICLKIFLERIRTLHGCIDFPIIELDQLVSDDSDQFKVLGLEIIRKSLSVIYLDSDPRAKLVVKKEKFLALLEKISRFIFSENNVCRSTTYEIFMDIFADDRFCADDEIKIKAKDVLLQGLVDHNAEIELTLINYWAKILPANTSDKFIFLLRNMYKASTENYYLGYYVNFLLNEVLLGENYEEAIFEYDLHDCTYSEYRIKDNWRERHSTLAPMFAQTYRSQSIDFDFTSSASTFGDDMLLRATNYDMEFEPTQQPELLEREKHDFLDRVIDVADENENNSDPDSAVFKKPWPVKARKLRFFTDQTKDDRRFAMRKLEQSTKVEKDRRDSIKQRQKEVNIYRRYRQGDFPDIKLTVSDLISPLRVLVKHDNRIAKIFYTILFESITDKVKNDPEEFVQNTLEGVNAIFDNSILYDTNLMGALFDVALKHKCFRFPSDVVAKVASNSGLLSSGALLLEEYLAVGFDVEDNSQDGPPPKRARGYTNSAEIDCWVKLADLYKELEEWDLVRAIFLHKMDCDETVINAIIEESHGYWREAQDLYSNVIATDSSLERRGFYYESYYKCFAELSDWQDLSRSIKLTVGEDDYWEELWDDDWNQQKLLPWYLIAELRNGSDSEQAKNAFVSQINEALSNTNKLIYMKQNFSEEIAFLYLLTGNFDKVMYFILNSIELFLSDWSNLSPLLAPLKMKKLLKMQNSLEIYNFVTRFNNFNRSNKNAILNDLCKDWLRIYRENLSSIVSNETRTIYRTRCLSILRAQFYCEDVRSRLDKVKFRLEMNLADTAVEMKNYHVAKKYVSMNGSYDDVGTKDGVKYTIAWSRLVRLKATRLESAQSQIEFLIEAWRPLSNCLTSEVVTNNPELYLSVNSYIYEIGRDISEILKSDESTVEDSIFKKKIREISGIDPPYTSQTISDYSFRSLRAALINTADSIDSKDEINLKAIAEGHFKLASFLRSDPSRNGELVTHVLKAMFYGSSEARHIFPCLLEVGELGSTYKDTFLKESDQIPEWMFIQWIPQLLANLDSANVTVIFPVLERIGKKYPQAVMYAYRLSKQKYKFENQPFESYGRQAIKILDELLGDPFVDKFLKALSSVSLWTNVLSYHIKQLNRACNVSEECFKQRLDELKSMCEEDVDHKDRNSLKGQVFKETVSNAQRLLKSVGKEAFNSKSIREKLASSLNSIKNANTDKSSGSRRGEDKILKLSYYSPWLENFSENEINLDLEIPGQYKGDKKPLSQYHVKICGFSSEIFKFRSLRSPLKLTIIGNDAKEYPFLVKFGEDLRQDQRIEQIFELMNNIFNNDSVCREKRLKIRTYQVIPLTSTLGLIECVPDTCTYKEFLEATVPGFTLKRCDEVGRLFNKWYSSGTSEALLRHTYESAVPIFQRTVKEFPSDLFRQAIWKLSVNTESFVALRNRFVKSHSVNCIANWILGIGDRHLSNSMVSLNNCQTMDIDFGYAFGFGVQILGVPELVPFRLTPHFVELMRPLGEHGLIEETMIHVLRALRNNRDALTSTMSVFVKEPSLEWMEFTLDENLATGYNWCPEKKLEQAKRKLDGASSVEIMVEELSDRTRNDKEWISKCIKIVEGRADSKRAGLIGKLSVENQVACLIDHATDPNVLVHLFGGFEAWI